MSNQDIVAELERGAANAALDARLEELVVPLMLTLYANGATNQEAVGACARAIGKILALDLCSKRRGRVAANLHQVIRIGAGLEPTAEPLKGETDEGTEG